MDRVTRAEIERIAAATLRDAGLTEPPLSVEILLQYVQLHRDYYDLANPGFLDRAKHKLRIDGHKLVDIINKVRLQAVLLFDENRICIDQELPKIKHPWASCHETGHRLLPWHKPFFFGDTAQTLDPNYQADLEAEANYAAGRLLFLGNRFTVVGLAVFVGGGLLFQSCFSTTGTLSDPGESILTEAEGVADGRATVQLWARVQTVTMSEARWGSLCAVVTSALIKE